MTSQFPAPRPLHYQQGLLHLSGVSLESLATSFGTPLYVYSAEDIRARVHMFLGGFGGLGHTICYAVKANSSLALLQLMAGLGCGFDVVSGGELERVRRAAPQALARVVFSGVGKQPWEIDAALRAGILQFNVESEAELHLLSERAQALGQTAPFALRVNPDVAVATHPYISTGLREHKFGLPLGEASRLYRLASRLGGLAATGVSVHIGSQIRETAPFREAVHRIADLVQQLRAAGHPLRYLDAGGGVGIEYGQVENEPRAELARYATAIEAALEGLEVHLLLEPGRFLVAQAGVLLTRVLVAKSNGSKHFAVADAAMNDLIRPALYGAHHEVLAVRQHTDGLTRTMDLVGPVCESADCFAHDRELAAGAGDLLVVLDAGAYGMSLSSNYNSRPRPAEVLIDSGQARLIRRRETIDDLLAPELL